jgi:hypothetical protein
MPGSRDDGFAPIAIPAKSPLTRSPSAPALSRVVSLSGERQAFALGGGLTPGDLRFLPSPLAGEGGEVLKDLAG